MSPKELTALAKVCRKHGIAKLRIADVELSMDLSHDNKALNQSEASIPAEPTEPAQDEESVMYWSSQA